MDYAALVGMHKGVIYLFLFSLITKTTIMFVNEEVAQKVRQKTKLVEMIVGPLIIITGLLVMNNMNWEAPSWLVTKMIIVFITIPFAAIAMKKGNKILALVTVLIFIYVFMVASRPDKSFNIFNGAPAVAVETTTAE